ncbi:MAG: hypothetical protein ACLQGP_04960 [Isosphaeraceae bacterium]
MIGAPIADIHYHGHFDRWIETGKLRHGHLRGKDSSTTEIRERHGKENPDEVVLFLLSVSVRVFRGYPFGIPFHSTTPGNP